MRGIRRWVDDGKGNTAEKVRVIEMILMYSRLQQQRRIVYGKLKSLIVYIRPLLLVE
jgi:hypothetical protein